MISSFVVAAAPAVGAFAAAAAVAAVDLERLEDVAHDHVFPTERSTIEKKAGRKYRASRQGGTSR